MLRIAVAALFSLLGAVNAHGAELIVSAAASLTNAFRDLGPIFERTHPGTNVLFNFASSGSLLQQLAKGAPADVFASADQKTMDDAQAKSLVRASERHDFAANKLVAIVPLKAPAPKVLADLARPPYARIAIGVPASVPVGRYTKAVLEKAGLWTAIEPKMIGAQSVRQALDYVARGEVDAGFVYATDAALMPGKVALAFVVPTDTPVRYPIAPVAGSRQPELARQFVAFVRSADARAVLARYGFSAP